MSGARWYAVKSARGAAPAELHMFGDIGAYGVTAQQFAADLKTIPGSTVALLINSPGGNVVDGLAICNVIQHSGKRVHGKVMGLAGSMASVIAAACHSLEMPENTFQFLHDPLADTGGSADADEHRELADTLDKVAAPIVAMYVKRSKQTEAKIKALMKADSLLSAQECLDLGLCDTVTPALEAVARHLPAADRARVAYAAGARRMGVEMHGSLAFLANDPAAWTRSYYAKQNALRSPA